MKKSLELTLGAVVAGLLLRNRPKRCFLNVGSKHLMGVLLIGFSMLSQIPEHL